MSASGSEGEKTATASRYDPTNKSFKENFDFVKVIGEGSFSTVHLAKDKQSGSLYAIKECDKSQILREKKVKYVHLEKKILFEYLKGHHFFVQLCFTFQDEDSLYFGLSYCPNGDLLAYIKKCEHFTQHVTQFYAAEIVEALEFMHSKNIIHRDLKPENILLDEKMHIKLTDFGTARIIEAPAADTPTADTAATTTTSGGEQEQDDDERTAAAQRARAARRKNSFVGTAQFVAPEILHGKEPHIGTDLWALGCIVYQMLTSKHLFTGSHEYDIFQKVVRTSYTLPEDFPDAAGDLIKNLIIPEPAKRLGSLGYDQLKAHRFFEAIDWHDLIKQVPPVPRTTPESTG